MPEIAWQEYDCPVSGIDFDLVGSAMVFEGDAFHCSGCGQEHVATPELLTQYYKLDSGTPFVCVPLQKRT